MYKKLALALITAGVIAAPAFAQTTAAPAAQPQTKAAKPHAQSAKTTSSKHHASKTRHRKQAPAAAKPASKSNAG